MRTATENPRDVAREIARKYDVRLSVEALSLFTSMLRPMKFRHRTFMIERGETCTGFYYITRGLIRQYKPSDDLDIVEDICHEGDMLISPQSMITQQPSESNIQTLEPTVAYHISYNDIKIAATHSEDINELLYRILEQLIIKQEDQRHLNDMPPKERYTYLLNKDSEIIRRTPLKYVASYLRMAPETLSRVRNTVNKSEHSNS